jgi:hypothetical protein
MRRRIIAIVTVLLLAVTGLAGLAGVTSAHADTIKGSFQG